MVFLDLTVMSVFSSFVPFFYGCVFVTQDVTFRGDPSISRVSDLKDFVAKLEVDAEEARRLASSDDFVSLNSGSGR